VALLMEHDAPVIAGILGALKASKFYVPLDSSLPQARIKSILEDLGSAYILTNTKNRSLAKSLAGAALQLVNIDELDNLPDTNPSIGVRPDYLSWSFTPPVQRENPKGLFKIIATSSIS
jgi:non-ribosomal peptide synthetase component F